MRALKNCHIHHILDSCRKFGATEARGELALDDVVLQRRHLSNFWDLQCIMTIPRKALFYATANF